jgi:hypothetical protein
LAQRRHVGALEVIDRRQPQTPPPSSVDERITTALAGAGHPLAFSELRGLRRVRTASLYQRLAALTVAGRIAKSDQGYLAEAAARPHNQLHRSALVTSASRMLYNAPEAVAGSRPPPAATAPLVRSFCSIGTILPPRPAQRPGRRAQRPSRRARLRATASAARSVLDGREHDGMLSRVGGRSAPLHRQEPTMTKLNLGLDQIPPSLNDVLNSVL